MGKWEMVRLGDVCRVQGGYAFKSERFTYNEIPILRIGDIQNGTVTIDYSVCSSPEFWDNNKQFRVYFGDVLIAMSGATVGKVGVYNLRDKALLNQRVGKISINKEYASNKYIIEVLKSETIRLQILQLAAGCAQPNISGKQLESMIIPLPPLPIQQKIADILDRASALIEKRKAQIEKLDLLVKSQFIEMFGDPVTNTKIWEFGTIRDLVSDVKYGTSKPAEEPGKYIYLRMNNITYDGQLDFSNIKYINVEDQELEKYVVRKGDLLFNRTNSKELVGKTAVFREKSPMIIAGYIIRVRTNQKANAEFLSGFLNSKYGKQLLFDMCKAIIGQANINAQELQDIKIYIPPLSLQNEFAVFVERVEAQKARIRKSLALLELNYKSLMQKCFSGEIF